MRSVTAITDIALFHGSSKAVPDHWAARQITTPFPYSAPRDWNHRPPLCRGYSQAIERLISLCASKRAVLLKRVPRVADQLGWLMLQEIPVSTSTPENARRELRPAQSHAQRKSHIATSQHAPALLRDFRPLDCSHVS